MELKMFSVRANNAHVIHVVPLGKDRIVDATLPTPRTSNRGVQDEVLLGVEWPLVHAATGVLEGKVLPIVIEEVDSIREPLHRVYVKVAVKSGCGYRGSL